MRDARRAIAHEIFMWRRLARGNPAIKYLCDQSIYALRTLSRATEFCK